MESLWSKLKANIINQDSQSREIFESHLVFSLNLTGRFGFFAWASLSSAVRHWSLLVYHFFVERSSCVWLNITYFVEPPGSSSRCYEEVKFGFAMGVSHARRFKDCWRGAAAFSIIPIEFRIHPSSHSYQSRKQLSYMAAPRYLNWCASFDWIHGIFGVVWSYLHRSLEQTVLEEF